MSTYAIGDIHGNLAALDDLLRRLEPGLHPTDTVVFLGDYIDRGPDTKGCVDRILGFRNEVPARVMTLIGNHEDWMLRTRKDFTRHSWLLGMEAFETIASYSREAVTELRSAIADAGIEIVTGHVRLPYEVFFDQVPEFHLEFFESLTTYCRTSDGLCVHGGLNPRGGPVEEQPSESLIWGTDDFAAEYRGEDLLVYGHWDNAVLDSEQFPRPARLGRTLGIDTISHGVLTAVRLPGGELIQSDRHPC